MQNNNFDYWMVTSQIGSQNAFLMRKDNCLFDNGEFNWHYYFNSTFKADCSLEVSCKAGVPEGVLRSRSMLNHILGLS